jgi:hypothetical protein
VKLTICYQFFIDGHPDVRWAAYFLGVPILWAHGLGQDKEEAKQKLIQYFNKTLSKNDISMEEFEFNLEK